MIVTSGILDVYVIRFDITHTNFPVDGIKSCMLKASIFFENGIFINVKKIPKIHVGSEKSINLFEMKKKHRLLDVKNNFASSYGKVFRIFFYIFKLGRSK